MAEPAVSLLGLGRMGEPMARHLLAGTGALTVWNRTETKGRVLADQGARVSRTPADAAAAVTITVLTDLADVEDLLDGDDGLLAGWRRRGVVDPLLVICGTVSPVGVVALGRRLAAHDVAVVDAPLSGGVAGAEAGTLSIMVGGGVADVARALPSLEHMGTTVRHLGPLGAGQLAKACNQIVVATTIAAISEALVLADSQGLDRELLLEILGGGLAASEVLTQKRARWIDGDFEGGGSSTNQLKDLRFVAEAAAASRLRLDVVDAVRQRFETAVTADGEGALDHSALVLSIGRHAGEEST